MICITLTHVSHVRILSTTKSLTDGHEAPSGPWCHPELRGRRAMDASATLVALEQEGFTEDAAIMADWWNKNQLLV